MRILVLFDCTARTYVRTRQRPRPRRYLGTDSVTTLDGIRDFGDCRFGNRTENRVVQYLKFKRLRSFKYQKTKLGGRDQSASARQRALDSSASWSSWTATPEGGTHSCARPIPVAVYSCESDRGREDQGPSQGSRSWLASQRRVGRHGHASPTTSSRCVRGAGGRGAPPHSNPR